MNNSNTSNINIFVNIILYLTFSAIQFQKVRLFYVWIVDGNGNFYN